ncbi:hypothetical protein CBS147346_8356 [Aspergillus niger]|nr:hypothetical protein CBS147346_8356 [Aspergillus niger]
MAALTFIIFLSGNHRWPISVCIGRRPRRSTDPTCDRVILIADVGCLVRLGAANFIDLTVRPVIVLPQYRLLLLGLTPDYLPIRTNGVSCNHFEAQSDVLA